MTDNKVEPMTLDEFRQLFSDESDRLESREEHYEARGVRNARRIFDKCRPALKAGCRGTLRFEIKQCKGVWHDYWTGTLLNKQGKPHRFTSEHERIDAVRWCEAEAQSLGMTAEFVEVPE